jgi:hypothetical protein
MIEKYIISSYWEIWTMWVPLSSDSTNIASSIPVLSCTDNQLKQLYNLCIKIEVLDWKKGMFQHVMIKIHKQRAENN